MYIRIYIHIRLLSKYIPISIIRIIYNSYKYIYLQVYIIIYLYNHIFINYIIIYTCTNIYYSCKYILV